MNRLSKAGLLGAAILAASHLFAAGLDADPGEVKISMGKTVYVSMTAQEDGKFVPQVLEAQPKEGAFISFALSESKGNRILAVTNKYSKSLSYKARMCMSERRLCANTSVIPVRAGLISFESWGDPIDMIVVSSLNLE
jgi:hypothetical protein